MDLKKTFAALGEEEILLKARNAYAVNTEAFSCDSYDYDAGYNEARKSYHGEYMTQYSWSDLRDGRFFNI